MRVQRIQEWWPKIKVLAEDLVGEWGLYALVIALSLASFGLGRLSALEGVMPRIQVMEATQSAGAGSITRGGMVVASRTGEIYHFPWCSGALRILPQNQRTFSSAEAARAAGLRPASNCKGLE